MGPAGRDRRARLAAATLYLVAGPESGGPGWLDAAAKALAGGAIGVVQLRDKDAGDAAFLAAAARLREACVPRGALLVLNDRVHLVVGARADGVHVGEHDASPDEARAALGPDLLVGGSTHDEAEVLEARGRGLDYAGLGPCHPTSSKRLERRPGGPDLVRRCTPLAGGLPLFPIGGITLENAPALVRAGARRLAVGSAVLGARDPAAAARALGAILAAPPPPGASGPPGC
jgi:thiamine-phosphate pyrophosphorylase